MSMLRAEAVVDGEERIAAFLHPAVSPERDTAVLLCPSFGWDAITSYRAKFVWAEQLAAAGFCTARYDLPGTGDSSGGPRDPGRVDAWVRSVTAVSTWLREQSGAERLAVLGVGFGGLLAWAAVAGGLQVDDLLLWATPAGGRAALRELQAAAAMVASRHPGDVDRPAEGLREGDLQLLGYLLRHEEAAALRQLRPVIELPAAPRRSLLIGRDGRTAPDIQREQLAAAGSEITVARSEDYETLLADPQSAELPVDTIDQVGRWLESAAGPGRPAPPAALTALTEITVDGQPVQEEYVHLDVAGERLFVVLARPAAATPAGLSVVFLGAGALRHEGPNRAWVETARRWAAAGVSSLRFDQLGVGDSAGQASDEVPNRSLYAGAATARVRGVLDQLGHLGLPERTLLVGLCSGAYWAIHQALSDPQVQGVALINLYALHWSEALVAERTTEKTLSSLRGRSWRRLARGDVTAAEMLERARSLAPGRLRERLARPQESAQQVVLEQAFDRLRERDVQVTLLFSHDEPLLRQLERQGFLEDPGRWPNLVLDRIPSRDHMFRALALQQHVARALDDCLRRSLPSTLRE